MLSLREIASALGGEIVGRQVLAPGPGHSRRDRSLSVMPSDTAPDGLVVHSHCDDDWRLCRDHVLGALGIVRGRHAPEPSPIDCMAARVARRREAEQAEAEVKARSDAALRIWAEAIDPTNTPVNTYLLGRGVTLPREAAGEAVRFHPACPFGAGRRTNAMVCLIRDMDSGEPRAIHRTAIDADGNGIVVDGHKRLSLGPIGNGAVMFTPRSRVGADLGVGEGVESTLSLVHVPGFDGALWALISASGFANLPILPAVDRLWIAVDHDPAGLRASHTLAARWRGANQDAVLVTPNKPGTDLNDLVRAHAEH